MAGLNPSAGGYVRFEEARIMANQGRRSVKTGGLVEAQASPDMTVKVNLGTAYFGSVEVQFSTVSSLSITASDPSNDRVDLVVVNNTGTVSVLDGTPATPPSAASVDIETYVVLARIFVGDGVTTITNTDITDLRVFTDISVVTPPIGSVMAWLKDYTSTPALAVGWVECNGQTLSDPNSVYNGQVIPDLNGNDYFLRGNSASGVTGGALVHTHDGTTNTGGTSQAGVQSGSGVTPHTHTFTTNIAPTIPPYYSVVWILRVK